MFCCQHCLQLLIILFRIVAPTSGWKILLTTVNNMSSITLLNPELNLLWKEIFFGQMFFLQFDTYNVQNLSAIIFSQIKQCKKITFETCNFELTTIQISTIVIGSSLNDNVEGNGTQNGG